MTPRKRTLGKTVHGLEAAAAATTPFHTFDPCDGDRLAKAVAGLEAARSGDHSILASLCQESGVKERLAAESVDSVDSREDIPWDDATFAWMCGLPNSQSSLPEPLDRGKARERLGRFPWGDGSPISYLRDNLNPPDGDAGRMTELIDALSGRLQEGVLGHRRFTEGVGRLCLCGFLSHAEVVDLRRLLMRGKWGVSSQEPLDGGVREVVKHLIVVLRSADSREVGVLLRAHG